MYSKVGVPTFCWSWLSPLGAVVRMSLTRQRHRRPGAANTHSARGRRLPTAAFNGSCSPIAIGTASPSSAYSVRSLIIIWSVQDISSQNIQEVIVKAQTSKPGSTFYSTYYTAKDILSSPHVPLFGFGTVALPVLEFDSF